MSSTDKNVTNNNIGKLERTRIVHRFRNIVLVSVFVVSSLVMLGLGAHAFQSQGNLSEETAQLLFSDDFSSETSGAPPSLWVIHNTEAVQVVEDPSAVGGKAVQMVAPSSSGFSSLSVKLTTQDPVVVAEYFVRTAGGYGTNFYMNGLRYNVNLFIDRDNNLGYRFTDQDGRITSLSAGQLLDGWNRIRIVANVVDQEAYVYLNDMNEARLGPLPFRSRVDDWSQLEPLFHVNTELPGEILYDNISIWSLTLEQFRSLPK